MSTAFILILRGTYRSWFLVGSRVYLDPGISRRAHVCPSQFLESRLLALGLMILDMQAHGGKVGSVKFELVFAPEEKVQARRYHDIHPRPPTSPLAQPSSAFLRLLAVHVGKLRGKFGNRVKFFGGLSFDSADMRIRVRLTAVFLKQTSLD